MAPAKTDLPQGTLDLLILRIVAAGPIHGYGLAQRIQVISRDVLTVPQGSLYPALHRLETSGLIAGSWERLPNGRQRRYYRLTPKGVTKLAQERAQWADFLTAVRMILQPGTA